MRNQEGIKIELQKKVHRRICVRGITFLTARHFFYAIFFCILHLHPPFSQVTYLLNGLYKKYIILRWLVLCVMIPWVNDQKYDSLLQFNTSWLASLRTWYYFRLYFSFSCSGCDLTLIKKTHILNCYFVLFTKVPV